MDYERQLQTWICPQDQIYQENQVKGGVKPETSPCKKATEGNWVSAKPPSSWRPSFVPPTPHVCSVGAKPPSSAPPTLHVRSVGAKPPSFAPPTLHDPNIPSPSLGLDGRSADVVVARNIYANVLRECGEVKQQRDGIDKMENVI